MSAKLDDSTTGTPQESSAAAGSVKVSTVSEGKGPRRVPSQIGRLSQRYALIVAWGAVALTFSLLRPETFATAANFQNIFGSQAVLLLLALALILPLTAGDFDLSIAFLMGLAAIVTAKLNADLGWALLPAVIVAAAIGLAVGGINACLIVGLGIDSFIVTLGVGTFLLGVADWVSNSQTISGVSSTLVTWTVTNRFLGISVAFWYGVALCVALWLTLEHTPLGRRLLFVGRNRNVSRLSGLRVNRLRAGALVASGLISALAGVVYVGSQGGIDPSAGQAFLLPAFAAAYLGATAIVPGRFNVWGTFIAVYFLVSGITGLQLLGLASFVQNLFYGGALVVAVALSRLVRRRALHEEDTAGA